MRIMLEEPHLGTSKSLLAHKHTLTAVVTMNPLVIISYCKNVQLCSPKNQGVVTSEIFVKFCSQ